MTETRDSGDRNERHWVWSARGADGSPVPDSVLAKWRWYSVHARRCRLEHYALELIILIIAAAIPVSAALDGGAGVGAVLGALVVVGAGLRQILGLNENWVSYSQARYAVEKEIALYAAGAAPYQIEPAARLVANVGALTENEGQDWSVRRLRGVPGGLAVPPPGNNL
ncbi:DUF4231 domain-containing protein [Spirillospora sp. NPDC047279]|uniref:DUF4231 domain-containing protein n=1 Tax=Spirillospora sp. NPDC047279 TaxID=3155478 RepID=UPI0033F01CF5